MGFVAGTKNQANRVSPVRTKGPVVEFPEVIVDSTDVSRRLRLLLLTPFAGVGDDIVARIEALNIPDATIELRVPAGVELEGPLSSQLECGPIPSELVWHVRRVINDLNAFVEVKASSGSLVQIALCRISGAPSIH